MAKSILSCRPPARGGMRALLDSATAIIRMDARVYQEKRCGSR